MRRLTQFGGHVMIEILALVAFLALVVAWFTLPSSVPASVTPTEFPEPTGSLASAQA